MDISKAIFSNVEDGALRDFLRRNKCKRAEDEKGLDIHIWISKLIKENRLDATDFNEYLFNDLFYYQRRLMRIYKIKNIRKINRTSDWEVGILEKFNIPSMDFNNIIGTGVGIEKEERIRISAVKSEYDSNNKLVNIKLLFVHNIVVREEQTVSHTYSYLPVEFNLIERTLIIKVKNRQFFTENYSSDDLMDRTINILGESLEFEFDNFEKRPEEVLYKMSKGLLEEFFNTIPNIDRLLSLTETVDEFVDKIMETGLYSNIEVKNVSGKILKSLDKNIVNLNDEILQLLQQAAAFDYFKCKSIESITGQISAILVSIRFNDIDNATASVTGEKRSRAIFNSKTFMSIRKSIDLVASVVALSIAYNKSRGKMIVKYDTSDNGFLKVHIINNRNYDESDFNTIWEMYKKYESDSIEETTEICEASNT